MAFELLLQGMPTLRPDHYVDMRSGLVTVDGTPDPRAVAAAIEHSGYDVHLLPTAAATA